jgi:hypothetical protein
MWDLKDMFNYLGQTTKKTIYQLGKKQKFSSLNKNHILRFWAYRLFFHKLFFLSCSLDIARYKIFNSYIFYY